MNSLKSKVRSVAILSITVISIAVLFSLEPIAQNPAYHQFADQRSMMGVPNFWNAISNLPFLLVGIMGLYRLFQNNRINIVPDIKTAYILLFGGVLLVTFGSAYYHLWPSNHTLVWDRLPMSLAFAALFAVVVGEFASARLSKHILWPMVFIGMFSVIYWHFSETRGTGDLRLYILVQFLPMLLIPVLLWMSDPRFTLSSGYWLMLGAYALAKGCEHFDLTIFNAFGVISGHSLKHIMAALAVYLLLRSFTRRETQP